MLIRHRAVFCLVLLLLCALSPVPCHLSFAQTETATLTGRISDPQGAVVPGAQVEITNIDTGIKTTAATNNDGLYVVPSLLPGRYRVIVHKDGFKEIVKPDIVLHVQDNVALNFSLEVGSITQSVTVAGGAPLINTESAAVSTVVDRQFAENLPMNGRSFQTLVQLTPGVVLVASTANDDGQFSVNGQRASSNYWMVDGVSANIGTGVGQFGTPGNSFTGAIGSFSAQGGTNSLVSIDALQEFRILTSTYGPEFGRTPGAQISIVTRSGTNQFHGTAFDFLRNDVLDANDWFANSVGLPKPQERQNDFGGTFSGPVLKDKTFFFFSYEGLRLRVPQTAITKVPDTNARKNALPAIQPFLNAYPLPTSGAPDDVATGIGQFNASYSNKATLDAYSIRIDHKLTNKLAFFGRYNYSPSETVQRGTNTIAPSVVSTSHITTQTATVGASWAISNSIVDSLRLNYSRANASRRNHLDDLGGAVPLATLPFPSPFTSQDSLFNFGIFSLNEFITEGRSGQSLQRQINIVDDLSVQRGPHSLKFGIDFRRLSPLFGARLYSQTSSFLDVPSSETGSLFLSFITAGRNAAFRFRNLGIFAQDTWRVTPRLTMTYGVRWDVDFAPSSIDGPSFPAITGYNLSDLSRLGLAPAGTPAFNTPFGNLAPRVGVAYQVVQKPDRGLVLRGGFGVFYDLATQEVGNTFKNSYPFGGQKLNCCFSGSFPLDSATAAPPPITPANLVSGTLAGFDPNLDLPYALQWNVALEQAFGREQTISASYIGSVGRRLIQSAFVFAPNSNLGSALLIGNTATSDYHALQLQYQRRLSHGLQALASYTWSHSIDTASAGSFGNAANTLVPTLNPNANRGPSDFDIRNAFSAALTYDIPVLKTNPFANAILRGWSVQNIIQARSAPPVDLFYSQQALLFNSLANSRPDLTPGIPLYLFGPQFPGGKTFNNTPGAVPGGCPDGSQSIGPFCPPPIDPNTFQPTRQGNLGRNMPRGFGATQWDFAVHRDFPIRESLRLQFRAEMFNVLNHPNFGQPIGDLGGLLAPNPQFGKSIQMLGRSLDQNTGGGGFSPLYQIGGPRSIQFALKLIF